MATVELELLYRMVAQWKYVKSFVNILKENIHTFFYRKINYDSEMRYFVNTVLLFNLLLERGNLILIIIQQLK